METPSRQVGGSPRSKTSFLLLRQISWAAQILFVSDTTLVKISILLFYRRITGGTYNKAFVYIVWTSIAFLASYWAAFMLVLLIGCM
jgi:hypothetical protein